MNRADAIVMRASLFALFGLSTVFGAFATVFAWLAFFGDLPEWQPYDLTMAGACLGIAAALNLAHQRLSA